MGDDMAAAKAESDKAKADAAEAVGKGAKVLSDAQAAGKAVVEQCNIALQGVQKKVSQSSQAICKAANELAQEVQKQTSTGLAAVAEAQQRVATFMQVLEFLQQNEQ